MACKPIQTAAAPAAIGPYSHAMEAPAGRIVFLSGQIPLDPGTMDIVEGGVTAQAHQVMRNLAAVLEAAGLAWKDVAKTSIFLADMADFAAVNEVYASYLGEHKPARATVQVAGLPKGVAVEIDAIAVG